MPTLLELFSGTKSVGDEFQKHGFDVMSVDMESKFSPTFCVDICDFDYKSIPPPDFVWASPPCETYSLAASWVPHREKGTGRAISGAAKKQMKSYVVLLRSLRTLTCLHA